MSFLDQLAAAISSASTFAQIDAASRLIWRAHAEGVLSDAAAQSAAEALQGRKSGLALPLRPNRGNRLCGLPRPIAPRSPDRERSLRRRRACAMSGAIPAKLASDFTVAEAATLAVVAAEVKRSGSCAWPLDKIAAVAGVSRTSAQNALRRAVGLGLVTVTERRRRGQRSLTNIIQIVAPFWRAWLKIGADRVQKSECHGNHLSRSPDKVERSRLRSGSVHVNVNSSGNFDETQPWQQKLRL